MTLVKRNQFKDLCYGYPVDLIASWCLVDVQTARHYKAGTRVPGKQAFLLFCLNLNGQIVPAEWEGFSFRGGHMWDPYGKPFSRAQLRMYGIAWQLMREWTKNDGDRRAALDELQGDDEHKLLAGAAAGHLPTSPAEPKASLEPGRSAETVRRALLNASPKGPDRYWMLSPELRAAANRNSRD